MFPGSCPALRCQDPDCDAALVDLPPPDPPQAVGRKGRRRRASNADAGVNATATTVAGGAVSFIVSHGKLRLRFPFGLMVPITKVNITTGSWRSVTLVYDSKQRRSPEGRIVRQSANLYLDGLLVSTRHASGIRMNATIVPAALLIGRDSGESGQDLARPGSPRLLFGGVSVYQGHFNDQAVLEQHSSDVQDALQAAKGNQRCTKAASMIDVNTGS